MKNEGRKQKKTLKKVQTFNQKGREKRELTHLV
jgi:hypothetical protein